MSKAITRHSVTETATTNAEAQGTTEPSFKTQLAEALLTASSSEIELGLASSSTAHASGRLLSKEHPQLVAGDSDYAYSPEEQPTLRAYAAASCLSHSSDAWSYFAQATRAILAGEFSIAKHLLYYSELRSAFSLLARHGILIRSRTHVVVQESGSFVFVKGANTHDAVWRALRAWAKTAGAKAFIFDNVMLDGRSMRAWLAAQGHDEAQTLAEFFQAIGYDLSRFAKDQAARNSASYGGRWLGKESQPAPMPKWFTEQLMDLWVLLEPIGASGFDGIDAELTGHALMRARAKSQESVQRKKYLPYLEVLAAKVGALQIKSTSERLMSICENSKTSLLGFALTTNPKNGSDNAELLGMLARAFVLARFGSAASSDLILKSGVGNSQMDFWYADVGRHMGLWPSSPSKSTFEVYEDIRENLGLLELGEAAVDLFSFHENSGSGIHQATNFGLLNVWTREDFEGPLPTISL